jgi:hypothetical protein
MPQPKYKISTQLLNSLKWELEKKVYYPINTKLDCKKIAQLFQQKTGKSISESTLYRMFLWNENQHTPYIHTLEIIAEFLDYNNWFELENRLYELIQFQNVFGAFPNEKHYTSLLSLTLNHGSLKPLYEFLHQFSSELSLDKKAILGEEIFLALSNNKNNIQFFKLFNTVPVVREGFFEIFADPEFSIPHYEIGLNYYLNQIKPHKSEKDLQDYIFANSLLLRHYFIRGLKDKVLEIGKRLYIDFQLDENSLNDIYIFPKSRYLSYKLLFLYVQNGFNQTYWEWLYDFAIKSAIILPEVEKRIVIHTLLDVLQINPTLQEKTYFELQLLFPEIFSLQPSYVNKLTISDKISYLDANGSRFISKNKARIAS